MSHSLEVSIDDDKKRQLTIRWSNLYNIDTIVVITVAQNSLLSTLEFIDITRKGFKCHPQVTTENYVLHVYGAKTTQGDRCQYQTVLNYAKIKVTAGITHKILCMDLQKCRNHCVPIKEKSEGSFILSIKRKPPYDYKLVVNQAAGKTVEYIIFIFYDELLTIWRVFGSSFALDAPFHLPPATWVTCQVLRKCEQGFDHSNTVVFETFLTTTENQRLYDLSLKFKKPIGQRPIKYFYRTKSPEYFEDIIHDKNGIMAPMLKNNGGEQGSVINGNFHGLFFSTFLDIRTNCPQPYSYFGPMRFNILADVLFTPDCNLYFVDFYCHYRKHHMALILTPVSSSRNSFCQKYLCKLNIFDNPFLCLRRGKHDGTWTVMANMDIIIEVYYTETVNITHTLKEKLGYMEEVDIVGRGFVLPCGIPKNPTCKKCNL